MSQIMNHLRLNEELQDGVLRGEFGYVPERLVRECIRYRSEAEQRRFLREHAEATGRVRHSGPGRPPRRVGREKVRVRLVAYFNPAMFVEQRALLSQRRQRVEDFVSDLNRRLRSSHAQREKEAVRVEVHNAISRWKLLRIYEIRIRGVRDAQTGRSPLQVRLELNEEDPKVRAHVTLCMLALLLERTIDRRLKHSRLQTTAVACFEELQTCHLNILSSYPGSEPVYVATEPTQEQRAILRSLRMLELIDPEEVAGHIQPRRIP